VKIITTGEGGMALTNDDALARRLRLLRTHGITRDAAQMARPSEGPWHNEQIELGLNYRMTDIQAALGTSQLERLDAFIARRRQLVQRYTGVLAGLPIRLPVERAGRKSAWHLYVINIDERSGKSRRAVYDAMRQRGVAVNVHYMPVYLHPYYRDKYGYRPADFPVALDSFERMLSLPLHPGLSAQDVADVIDAVQDVARTFRRSVR